MPEWVVFTGFGRPRRCKAPAVSRYPRLRQRREELHLTITQLAQVTGLAPSMISRWENGLDEPQLRSAVTVARSLDVSLDWLVEVDE